MFSSDIKILFFVNFLHAFGVGALVPIFALDLRKSGKNLVTIGLTYSFAYMFTEISPDVLAAFGNCAKDQIVFSLSTAVLFYGLAVFYVKWWVLVLCRCLYALVCGIQYNSKLYARQTQINEDFIKISNILDVVRYFGIGLGAIFGSHYYEWSGKPLSHNAAISCGLMILSLILIRTIESDPSTMELQKSQSRWNNLNHEFSALKRANLRKQWDSILLKLSYLCAFIAFNKHYAYLIRYNFDAKVTHIGYIIAHENVILFLSNCFLPFTKKRWENTKEVLNTSMVITCFALLSAYYVPTYTWLLVVYVPLFYMHVFVNSLLKEDALQLKSEADIHEASELLVKLAHVISPVLFGTVCTIFGGTVYKIVATVPIWMCLSLVCLRIKKENETRDRRDE